jgi:sodium pump decarboxylase gamma subunit
VTELLETGVVLMAVGMGTVYLLLATLVGVVHGVSKLSRMLGAAAPIEAARPGARAATAVEDHEIAGVISAAIRMHRDKHAAKKR